MANRTCYYTNEAFAEDDPTGTVYVLAKITENEPGYEVASKHNSIDGAVFAMNTRNSDLKLTWDDVLNIVASSFAAGEVSR